MATADMNDLIQKLIAVARASYFAMDESEEQHDGSGVIDAQNYASLQQALDVLEALPEEPGYESTGPRKAEYLFERLKG